MPARRILGRSFVAIVLPRKVFAPLRRVDGIFGELDELEAMLLGLLLTLVDIHQQRHDAKRDGGGDQDRDQIAPAAGGGR